MLEIYLTRHGQDEDNLNGILNGRRDKPLTLVGKEQASELVQKIKDAGIIFDKVYCSPLQRACETAKIITDELGMEDSEVRDDLIERDFGIMTGKRSDEIEKVCASDVIKTEKVCYFLNPEGAETFPQLIERGKRIIETIQQRHQLGNILLVTHGDIGKMIYAAFYNLDWNEVLEMFHFGNSDLLLLSRNSPAEEAHVFVSKQLNA